MTDENDPSGWLTFAAEYIRFIDDGDSSRTMLLDDLMLEECGNVDGQLILDIGAGEGRFSRMLAARGARTVALDLFWPMVQAARHRSAGQSAIVRCPATVLPIASSTVDTVVSYVVWVDVPDFRSAIAEAARVLRPGGNLVAANLGFITASPGWERSPDGRRVFRPVDQYVDERPITLNWRGHQVVNWHRPLSAYMQAYLSANLNLRTFLEPVPPTDTLRHNPRFEDWYRIPEFTLMRWQKP
ncbi:MAG: class I SAM-dependent methyltransferase [Gemmatimonadetes bacterium]|nr:class I SAM-dependent methyltransferase [Gemmatimonadota bacterium]